MKDYWKHGFHVGPSGNSDGIGLYMDKLDAAKRPFNIKSVDDYGFIEEALTHTNAAHIMVYRMTSRDGTSLDLPFYHIEDPNQAAAEHWNLLKKYLPTEYVTSEDAKRRVWLEFINEPDKGRSDWLGYYSTAFAKLANAEGFKVLAYGWSTGEPEPEHWSTPGQQEYLRYCSANKEKAGVALHEYSLTSQNLDRWYPWLVGRFQKLWDTCDALGIKRPYVHMTEFGWTYDNAPSVADGMPDLHWAQNEYKMDPDILGSAIWYLGSCDAWNGICHKVQKYIAPVTDAALAYVMEDIPDVVENKPTVVNGDFSNGYGVVDYENEVPAGWQMAWYGIGQPLPNEVEVTNIPSAQHEVINGNTVYTVSGSGVWGLALIPSFTNLKPLSEYKITIKVTVDYQTPNASQDPYDVTVDLSIGHDRWSWGSATLQDNKQVVLYWNGDSNQVGNLAVLLQVYTKLMNTRKVYIDDVSIEYIGDATVITPPDPCEDCVRLGDAREPYNRTYFRVNSKATLEQFLQVATEAYKTKATVGFSADDAGIGVGIGVKTVNEVGGEYAQEVIEEWYFRNYGVTEVNHIGYTTTPPIVPPPTGRSIPKFGIHTSADSRLMTGDLAMLNTIKPESIKLLSGFPQNEVNTLVKAFPKASYIVRAFLSFGGRKVTPQQFYDWTINDVVRTVDTLVAGGVGKDRLFLELHNEPNLVDEGLVSSWANGREFGVWLADVATRYKQALGTKVQLLYPGLSPGGAIAGGRAESRVFFNESKSSLAFVDAVAIHGYWSPAFDALTHPDAIIQTVNWYNENASGKKLHITESCNNSGAVPFDEKARQYVSIWNTLKTKSNVDSVNFFVLSASNPSWGATGSKEIWTPSMCTIVSAR